MQNNSKIFESSIPSIDIPRSRFNMPSKNKTTFNNGQLIPIYLTNVMPGDTIDMQLNTLLRGSTFITPVMDDLFLDTYFFFIPTRLVWSHFVNFMGENTQTKWYDPTEYQIPQLKAPTGGWNNGTLADYFGIPTGIDNIKVNALPFRAYSLVYNSWFRDENLQDPILIDIGDAEAQGTNGDIYVSDPTLGGMPCKVNRFADIFSKALPSPQKGPDVLLPLGEAQINNIPLDTTENAYMFASGKNQKLKTNETLEQNKMYPLYFTETGTMMSKGNTTIGDARYAIKGTNLVASGTGTIESNATINDLRLAFQLQKFYEKNARGGTRYIEIIKSHFDVDSPDARLQRPEYLAGDRIPINIEQVVQNSESGSTPQGHMTAFSLTFSRNTSFVKSFTEHGYILGLACIRHNHSYQQGIPYEFTQKNLLDFYFPSFANIGETPLKNELIYAKGTDADKEVFGYQEAWANYRYKPNMITGQFRSNYAQTLDSWHFADNYETQPILGQDWLQETEKEIDRALAVQSTNNHQFLADFDFDCKMTRPMPLYSIPGLIDHH